MKRAKAPDNVEVTPLHVDMRAKIAAEWDAKEPEFIHAWEPDETTKKALGRRGGTIVEEEGDGGVMEPLTLRNDMLVRFSRKEMTATSERGRAESYRRVKTSWARADNVDLKGKSRKLERHAKAKKPPYEEDIEEEEIAILDE